MAIYEKSKAKEIIDDKVAIDKIVSSTIKRMANVTKATLGPGGRGVLIERDGLSPYVTKDGVSVVKSLGVHRAEENVIVETCKEICLNTAKDAGDGTTTAIVLADAIVSAGQEFLAANPKYNPQRFANELNNLYNKVLVPRIKELANKADTEEKLFNVAMISSNGDEEIAKVVVDAVMAAGDDGAVLLQEAQGNEMRLETIDGYIVTSGLKEIGSLAQIFINDRANQQCKMDNGIVVLYDGSINDLKATGHIQDALQNSLLYGSPIIVMAHDFSDQAIQAFAKTMKGGVTVCPVITPRSGVPNSKTMFLHDMAAYTGAKIFDPSDIANITEEDFGHFKSARINLYECFLTTEPSTESIDARVEELRSIISHCHSDIDRQAIKACIGKLTGGISTIWVGGATDLEVREKKARVEDAVEAVRSAIAEGVVAGGCHTHRMLIEFMENHPDKKPSWKVMIEALKVPFTALLENCGENPDEILPLLTVETIFDANEHSIVNPFEQGIIEPSKVIRVSLGNALSIASLLITLGGIVVAPRDLGMEMQSELSKQAFRDLMSSGGLGQE